MSAGPLINVRTIANIAMSALAVYANIIADATAMKADQIFDTL